MNYLSNTVKSWKNAALHFQKCPAIIALCYALVAMMLYNPLANNSAKTFNRIMGNGLLNGIDIEKRINHFYLWYLIIPIVLFAVLYNLLNKLYKATKTDDNAEKAWNFALVTASFSFIPIVYKLSNFLNSDAVLSLQFGLALSLILSFSAICFAAICKYKHIGFDFLKWLLFFSISVSLDSLLLISKYHSVSPKSYTLFCAVIICMFTIVLLRFQQGVMSDNTMNLLKISAVFSAYSIGIVSLFLELCNILNQYGIYIYHRRIIAILIAAISLAASVFLSLILKKRNINHLSARWESAFYFGLIFSFAMIVAQPLLQSTISTDLFEASNHGLAVNEFFNHGKIPLIETFDAHMLSSSIWGIIYGILNRDTFGAIFCVYTGYQGVINILILFLLLRKYFNSYSAFLFCILIPQILPVNISYFALISVVCLMYAVRKNTFSAYLLFWFSLVVSCLYLLDSGAAFSFATTLILGLYLVYCIIIKKVEYRKIISRVLLSLFVTLGICGCLFVGICFGKNINPFVRAREFLSIAMSNVNWALATIGSPSTAGYAFCYVLIPILVVTLLLIICYLKLKGCCISTGRFIVLLSLGFAYLFNLSRAMVRHSLAESQYGIVLFSSVFFITLAVTELFGCRKATVASVSAAKDSLDTGLIFKLNIGKYTSIAFVTVFLSMLLLVGTFNTASSYTGLNMSDSFFTKLVSEDYTVPTQKVNRIAISQDMENSYKPIVDTIHSLMRKNETYVDFTNQTLLYALSGKEKPIYINQSPGLLSGEYSQEQFISEIEGNPHVKYALMPANGNLKLGTSCDGIQNSFRFYKVSEYISQNFRPLCVSGNYSIWVKNSEYNEAKDNLSAISSLLECDYNYGNLDSLHTYSLGQLAYLWGTADQKKAYDNPVIKDALKYVDGNYQIHNNVIDKTKGNYIKITANAAESGTGKVTLASSGGHGYTTTFTFDVLKGKQTYLIRVSCDFLWYSNYLQNMTISSKNFSNDIAVEILAGD